MRDTLRGMSSDPTSRMLRLLSLLQTHRFWPGAELADRLEVSPRTLRRDVDRLRELGYPVHASRGVAGGYQLEAGTSMPPLLLDEEEAVAIAVGLRTAANGSVAGIEETSVRALAKLEQVLPGHLRRRVATLHDATIPLPGFAGLPTVDPEALTVIAAACRDHERLRFEYRRADDEESTRVVEPERLVCAGRRWYLVAWDCDRGAWRSFRVDRLSRPRSAGAFFEPRELPAEDAARFVQQSLAALRTKVDAVVAFAAPAATIDAIMRRWGGEVEPEGPDRCVMRIASDSVEWLALYLGLVGHDFEVRSPPELVERVELLAKRYGAAAPGA